MFIRRIIEKFRVNAAEGWSSLTLSVHISNHLSQDWPNYTYRGPEDVPRPLIIDQFPTSGLHLTLFPCGLPLPLCSCRQSWRKSSRWWSVSEKPMYLQCSDAEIIQILAHCARESEGQMVHLSSSQAEVCISLFYSPPAVLRLFSLLSHLQLDFPSPQDVVDFPVGQCRPCF